MSAYQDEPAVEVDYRYQCAACCALVREHTGQCPRCFRNGVVLQRYSRPSDVSLPSQPGVSAADLVRQTSRPLLVPSCPGLALGAGALVLSYGPPAQGKTNALLKAADCLSPSVFIPMEMGIGPLLADYLRRLEIINPRLRFEDVRSLSQMYELAASGVRAMFIDSFSVSTLQCEDALRLARANRIVLWGSSQVTKANIPAGSMAWIHAADVVMRVDAGRWTVEKSRYQQVGVTGEV